jgi:hypothetical protein
MGTEGRGCRGVSEPGKLRAATLPPHSTKISRAARVLGPETISMLPSCDQNQHSDIAAKIRSILNYSTLEYSSVTPQEIIQPDIK